MKILVLTSRFPFPLEKGDKLRIYNQMRALARLGHEIVLIALAEDAVSEAYLNDIKQFCSRVYVYKLTKSALFSNILGNILRGPRLPFQVAYFFNATIKNQIKQVISAEKPDHIYCHLVRMSEYVSDVALPKTLDFMDAFGAGTRRRADIAPFFLRFLWQFEARLMLMYEKNIASKFDNLTIISEQDRARLPIDAASVSVIGNGVDVEFFSLNSFNEKQLEFDKSNVNFDKSNAKLDESNIEFDESNIEFDKSNAESDKSNAESDKSNVEFRLSELNKNDLMHNEYLSNQLEFNEKNMDKDELIFVHKNLTNKELDERTNALNLVNHNANLIKKYDVCFVGNLGYYSNVEAVRYLVKKIFPLLKTLKPDIKILLAGARPTAEIQGFANEHITVLGWLDDIREAYAASRILVAPLMHGIGQQNKILEAMAMHVPVVATSRVNNAIGAKPKTEILVADTEGSFAEQILRLLQSLDFQGFIADNGRDFVVKNYSWDGATGDLSPLMFKELKFGITG